MPVSSEPTAMTVMPAIHAWWQARHQEDWSADILAVLDIVSLDAIAAGHGLSRATLVDLAESDPSACGEMIRMMRALNIDPAEAAGEAEFADMAGNCAGCANKRRCREHLADGTAAGHLNDFCENAAALNAMRATPHLMASAS